MPETSPSVSATKPTSSAAPANGVQGADGGDEGEGGVKHFVLDTNVLLHNPNALFVFQEHEVVIPFAVIEELDRLKRGNDDIGRNARECIRHLDRLRGQGRLIDGVRWGDISPVAGMAASTGKDGKTGTIRIDVAQHDRPSILGADTPDNRIIAVAWALHTGQPSACAHLSAQWSGGMPVPDGSACRRVTVVFVSKDLNARIKSDALGIRTEDFENQKVDAERLYTGFFQVAAPGDLIDELYSERMLAIERLRPHMDQREVVSNQFIILKDADDEGHTGLARRLADTDHLIPITGPRKPTFGVMPRNVQQTMAMDLLLDDEIRMVTLLGSAGTGKTLLAVAAGMAKVFNEERYDKLLVARPIMPMGRDIGYLPGDKDEKLTAWMQPIFDNLAYLLSHRLNGHGDDKAESHKQQMQGIEGRISALISEGTVVLEPLTYIRGRSIPNQYMIVDEAQNLTPHEVKTIASRVGEGTKLVLTGDATQIDNPYLDSSSNGISYLVERLKGRSLVGHVTLQRSERSQLASLAAEAL